MRLNVRAPPEAVGLSSCGLKWCKKDKRWEGNFSALGKLQLLSELKSLGYSLEPDQGTKAEEPTK